MLRIAPLLCLALCASQPTLGRRGSLILPHDADQAATGLAKKSPPDTEAQARSREQKRIQDLLIVHGFADHIIEFKDLTPKVRGMIAMADALWKEDEPYARKLFRSAFEAATADGQASGAAREGGVSGESSTPDFGWLWREVVARIAGHDPAWAKALVTKEADESKTNSILLSMAGALVEDEPKQASQYVEMSLKSGFDPGIGSVLFALRSKDPAAADAFFLKSLQSLAAQPQVDANELVFFGQYVLASEALLTDSGIWIVRVGNHVVYNFSTVRPDASTAALQAYLETAAGILSRPGLSQSDKEENYLAACLLLPKVRQFAPGSAAQLETAIRDLAPDMPSGITEDAVNARLNAAQPANPESRDEALKDVDSIHDDARRDSRCIGLCYRFYQKGDFGAARAIAGEVQELQVREKLLLLVGFEEAAKLIDHGKLNDAASITAKLAPGIERALLWLAIAHRQIEHGNTKLAGQTIAWSLSDAYRIQDPRRAVLILRAAADLAPFDPLLASQTLNEAVRTLNHVAPYTPLKTRWAEQPSPRSVPSFPLEAGGLDFKLSRMLGPLAKVDMDGTILEVMTLDDEEARGQSLAALASLILEKKAAN
jgi:hypothetical protein